MQHTILRNVTQHIVDTMPRTSDHSTSAVHIPMLAEPLLVRDG